MNFREHFIRLKYMRLKLVISFWSLLPTLAWADASEFRSFQPQPINKKPTAACIDCSCLQSGELLKTDAAMVNVPAPQSGVSVQIHDRQQPFASLGMLRFAWKAYEENGFVGGQADFIRRQVDFAESLDPKIITRPMGVQRFLRYRVQSQELMFIADGRILLSGRFYSDAQMLDFNDRGYPFPVAELLEKRIFILVGAHFDGSLFKFNPLSLIEHFAKHGPDMRKPNAAAYQESARMHISEKSPDTLTVIIDKSPSANGMQLANPRTYYHMSLTGFPRQVHLTVFSKRDFITHYVGNYENRKDEFISTTVLHGAAGSSKNRRR